MHCDLMKVSRALTIFVCRLAFVRDGEVVSFHRVPGDAIGREVEHCPVQRRVGAHIVQDDSAVGCARCYN
jgi:hypothetical protein